jgi:hypothetical protein
MSLMKTPTKSGQMRHKNHLLLGIDRLDIGTGKEALAVFMVKVHVLDDNSHKIWSNEAQKIISSLALMS